MSYKSIWDFGREAKAKVGPHALVEYPSKILANAAHEVVNRFSKEGDLILDPFCGCGTFAIEAKALNRNSINYDINENAIELVNKALNGFSNQKTLSNVFNKCPGCETDLKKPIELKETEHIAKIQDSRKMELPDEHVDSIITDIPYASMIKYSDKKDDLSNVEDYSEFLSEISKSFNEMWRVLKKDKYCVVFVADYRIGAARKILPVHTDVINIMRDIGFTLFDLFVWRYYRSGGFRPFGKAPFQAMNIHSYILVFHKPGEEGELQKRNRDVRYRPDLIRKLNNNHNSN
tara:strand:- start:1154 stop:2023 length:870 start_codon:yes stop_codon:yes gene_type:complete